MTWEIGPSPNRSENIDYVSRELPTRTALLARLLVRQLGAELSRTEAGLLNTLTGGPRRITELAELEGLAQPTMTVLVTQLEQQGLVTRERHISDGRVVLVNLTETGTAALENYRALVGAALGDYLAELPDEEIESLAAATRTLAQLVTVLQQRQ
jgi:DNA-binding MarR family transcriptional regulator